MAREPEALRPVYLFTGDDRAKMDRALVRLAVRAREEGGMDPDRFDATEASVDEVLSACQALSFGGRRVVVVENADVWKAADGDRVAEYLGDANPMTVLAMVAPEGVPQRLLHAVREHGEALHWGPDPKAKDRDRRRWLETYVEGEAARLGARMPPAAARALVDRVASDVRDRRRFGEAVLALGHEAAKLAAYADGAPIDREMVQALTPAHPEARVYELSDALTAGRAADAFRLLQDMAGGDQAVAPIVVQAGLLRHFRAVAAVQAAGGLPTADVVTRATGISGFPARKLAEAVPGIPAGAGGRAVARLARLELDLRVAAEAQLGRSSDDGRRFVLERAVHDLLAIMAGHPVHASAGAG
ncbi:MAG TPA: hypothetical protein VNT51_14375 [Miltoncostaeaceae bacterium]|nr:hypothetical protein [Miltoncostaeaceae bacterium]